MINLIEHLWQLELSQNKITPTIIKVRNQSPKLYFYSEKQSKVLRKKEHSVQACINYLKQFNKQNQHYLLMKIQKNKIRPSLILLNQVAVQIEKQDQCLAILSIEWNSKIQKIYLCECKFSENIFKAKILMQKYNQIWYSKQQKLQNQNSSHIIEKCIKMCTNLLIKLKINKKCNQFNVIVGTDFCQNELFWLWCSTFKWNQQSFYQIDFDFQQVKSQTINFSIKERPVFFSNYQNKTTSENFISQLKDSQYSFSKEIVINEKVTDFENTQVEKCKGCQNYSDKSKIKQVSFDEIISLRRHNKLSIKGITDQFAPVCHTCYTLLEQLENSC